MILKQLKNSLDYLIDEIHDTREYLYDNTNIVSLEVEDDNIYIVIDDLYTSAYTYQIYRYTNDILDDIDRDKLKTKILLNNDILYNDLKVLVNNAYDYVNNNINDIIHYMKLYKYKKDTHYLSLGVTNEQIESYIDTVTEVYYLYEIFDTDRLTMLEEIEDKTLTDNELKDLILKATKEQIIEWNFLLENFENEE